MPASHCARTPVREMCEKPPNLPKSFPLGASGGTGRGVSCWNQSAPRVIRTPDLLIRSQTLYPTELWARDEERLVLADVSLVNSHPPGGPARGRLPSSQRCDRRWSRAESEYS